MNENLIQAIALIAAAGLTGVITWMVAKLQNKGKPENALIDQLQEQITRADNRLDAAFSRIDGLEKEQTASKARERALGDYVNSLRQHIAEEKGPPPPPWPEGLYM